MKRVATVTVVGTTLLLISGHARDARGAVNTCNTTEPCVYWENTGTTGGAAIRGQTLSTGAPGVEGLSIHGSAVTAKSTNWVGLAAESTNYKGIHSYAPNGDAIEAVSGNSGSSGIFARNTSGGGYGVYAYAPGSGQAIHGENTNSSGWAGWFNGKVFASDAYKPGGGSWTDSSDARLKKEVKPIEGALERLLNLKGVTFEWKDPKSHGNLTGRQTGMIAQQVEKVFPEWVGTDSSGFKTLTFRGFEALSVEAMRSLRTENETLRSQVSGLEDRIRDQEARIARIERGPMASSMTSGVLGSAVVLCGLPLAVTVAIRRRGRGSGKWWRRKDDN